MNLMSIRGRINISTISLPILVKQTALSYATEHAISQKLDGKVSNSPVLKNTCKSKIFKISIVCNSFLIVIQTKVLYNYSFSYVILVVATCPFSLKAKDKL